MCSSDLTAWLMKGIVALLGAAFLASCIFTVNPNEVAVVLRFGRPLGTGPDMLRKQGLHFALPYPVDEIVRIRVGEVQTVVTKTPWARIDPADEALGNLTPPKDRDRLTPAADGHVLFSTPSMPGYGKLSGRSRDEQIAGARVEVAPYKRDPADFVLWKPSAPDQPGWDSPWGRGRPGWHLECSAMSEAYLGESFDIHGGGHDLIFPHHENEIAQSECCNGVPFSRHWYHSEHLLVDGTTMSKSKGNYYTLRDLVAKGHEAMAVRFALLMGHPRKQLNFTLDSLHAAAKIGRAHV